MTTATGPAWEDITNTDTWDNLPQRDRDDLARFYARKVLQPQHGPGSPHVRDFLQKNLSQAKVDQPGIIGRAAASLPVAPAFEDAYGEATDAGLTGALMRGKPIDPTALPQGLAAMGRGIADAAQSVDLNPMAPGFGEGAQAMAGSILGGTVGDPAGTALGLAAGAGAGKVLGAAARVSPIIGAPIARAVEAPAAGLAGGLAVGTAIPLAEHRMPTAADIGPQAALGFATGAVGALGRRAPRPRPVAPEAPPEAGPRPNPNEPPPGPGAGPSGFDPPPPGPEAQTPPRPRQRPRPSQGQQEQPRTEAPGGNSQGERTSEFGHDYDFESRMGEVEDHINTHRNQEAELQRMLDRLDTMPPSAKRDANRLGISKALDAIRSKLADWESLHGRLSEGKAQRDAARGSQGSEAAAPDAASVAPHPALRTADTMLAHQLAQDAHAEGPAAGIPHEAPGATSYRVNPDGSHYGAVDPRHIQTDANAYQFKAGGDHEGVTGRLADVQTWDHHQGQKPLIVHRRRDGSMYVVDGHQRLGLARRLQAAGQDVPHLNATIYDEGLNPAFDTGHMRRLGAIANIQEGTGTSLDIAKVLREGGELSGAELARIPQGSSPLLRDGRELAKLGHEAFTYAANERIIPGHPAKNAAVAAVVARLVKDHHNQAEVMRQLAADPPAGVNEATDMVHEILAAGFTHHEQTALFGVESYAEALHKPMAKLMGAVRRRLNEEKSALGNALRNRARLENRGSTIDTSKATEGYLHADALSGLLNALGSNKSGFRDELRTIARSFKNGEISEKQAVNAATDAIQREYDATFGREREPGQAQGGAGLFPGEGDGAGRDVPRGARRGSVNPTLALDLAYEGARAAGRVIVRGANLVRRIVEALHSPVDWIDTRWRATTLHQKLVDWREALKYGKAGGPLVNLMRKTFVSDYGVHPELLAMAEEARLQARNEVLPFRRKAKQLQKDLNPNQQAALDYQVTEPAPQGLRSVEAEEIGDESARLSKLLNDVGALHDKAFQRWKGYYLPRVYEDRFPVLSSWIRETKTLRGNKARGKSLEMSPKRFAELSQDWTEISNSRGGRQRLVEIENAKGERLLVTQRTAGDYLGTWEQRGTSSDGKIQAWRDWTLGERSRMGEIRHASLRMHQLANKFESDYARGKLFADLAKNPKFSLPAKGLPPGHEPDGWELLDNRKNKDGTYKWGKLANHWVDPDTYQYLTWHDEFRRTLALIKTASGQTLWKRFMTIDNPSYYLNNFMQNVPMLQLAGGSTFDIPQAAMEFINKTPKYQALVAAGALENAPVARELAVMLQHAQVSSAGPLEMMLVLARACKGLEAKGANFGAATDDVFRMALALQKEREGITDPKLIAQAIDGVFYDPSKVTSPAAEAASVVAPFAKSFFYTVDRLPQLILDRPARALSLVVQMALFTTFMGWASGYDTAEKRRGFEALLPEYMKADPITHAPGALPLPIKDSYGQPLILDTHNWNPMQAVEGDQKADSPIPSQLLPGGPIFTLADAFKNNYDSFKRQTLRDHTPGGITIKDDTPEFLRNGLLPAMVGLKGGKLLDALQGRTDAAGRHFDVATAIGQVFGVKIQPFDNARALQLVNNHFKAQMGAIGQQMKDLGKRMAANPQDTQKLQAQIDALAEKQQAIGQEWQQVVDLASQGTPTETPAPQAAPRPAPTFAPNSTAAQQAPDAVRRGLAAPF